jgi:hypothetical protein
MELITTLYKTSGEALFSLMQLKGTTEYPMLCAGATLFAPPKHFGAKGRKAVLNGSHVP